MTGPRIGELAPDWQIARCSYSPSEHEPACLRDAIWHGIELVANDGQEKVRGLESCAVHRFVMEALVTHVHQMGSACGLPEARFNPKRNECELIVDRRGVGS